MARVGVRYRLADLVRVVVWRLRSRLRRRRRKSRASSLSLPAAVVITTTAASLLACILVASFSKLAYGTWRPWTQAQDTSVADLVKIALAFVAGVGATQALVVAYRRQRTAEIDAAGERDRVRLLTERFGMATAQLGSEHAATRIAGVYALAALADEWAEQRQQCIDVLCGYMRLPYPASGEEVHKAGAVDLSSPTVAAEREVRRSIVDVITHHLGGGWQSNDIDWQGAVFNFNGAVFLGGDFGSCSFEDDTKIFFEGCTFVGGPTTFDGAHFLGGTVSFKRSTFHDVRVSFRDCDFSGRSGLSFELALLEGATVDFGRSEFEDGAVVSFKNLRFTAGYLYVTSCLLSEARLDFRGMVLWGGELLFDASTLLAGTVVNFEGADLRSGLITLDAAQLDDSSRVVMNDVIYGEALVTRNGQGFCGGPPE